MAIDEPEANLMFSVEKKPAFEVAEDRNRYESLHLNADFSNVAAYPRVASIARIADLGNQNQQ